MVDKMRITILGRLSVMQGIVWATVPSAPRERKLLALLLLNFGRVVPAHLLIDKLWGSNPPRSVRTALQTYILNIRSKLARQLQLPHAWVRDNLLVRDNEGYQFQMGRCEYDLEDYLELAGLGERVSADGNDELAVEALRKAEALGTGSIRSPASTAGGNGSVPKGDGGRAAWSQPDADSVRRTS
jgi:DNA-binding SARP family transcriptional activator